MDVFIIASSLLFPSFGADGQRIPFDSKFSIAVYGMIIVTVCGHVVDLYLAAPAEVSSCLFFQDTMRRSPTWSPRISTEV